MRQNIQKYVIFCTFWFFWWLYFTQWLINTIIMSKFLKYSFVHDSTFIADFLKSGSNEDGSYPELTFEQLPFNHPLFVMYSSGTTGAPKCMVHSAGVWIFITSFWLTNHSMSLFLSLNKGTSKLTSLKVEWNKKFTQSFPEDCCICLIYGAVILLYQAKWMYMICWMVSR